MKVDNPKKLKVGTVLHWWDGDTAVVENQSWGSTIVRWKGGRREIYPHDDPIWHNFKVYGE
jgi:hypothetical protein